MFGIVKKILPQSACDRLGEMRFMQIQKSRFFTKNPLNWVRRDQFFKKKEKEGLDTIPIFLVSYNRLSYLEKTISCLEARGKTNIIIIDNQSSYPPLLEYYKKIPYKVIYMDKNYGHKVFWEHSMFEEYRKDFYILSDPDVIPTDECPNDFVEVMFKLLKRFPNMRKVGFSLRIDDFPANGAFGPSVINWEKQYYKHKLKKWNAYLAATDTTFALYHPDQFVNPAVGFYTALRTGHPYEAHHLPWYRIMGDITEEDNFYTATNKLKGWDVNNHRHSQ